MLVAFGRRVLLSDASDRQMVAGLLERSKNMDSTEICIKRVSCLALWHGVVPPNIGNGSRL
jgi:hypothetical protein